MRQGAILELEHVIEQLRQADCDGLLGFAVETEGLAGDVGDALQLLLGDIGEVAGGVVEGGVIADADTECW